MIINVIRNGGAGDVVATSAAVSQLKVKYPHSTIFYFTKAKEVARYIPDVIVVDSDYWNHRPVGLDINFKGYPLTDTRLCDNYCRDAGVQPTRLKLLDCPQIKFGDYITVQSVTGWSRFKDFDFTGVNFPLPIVRIDDKLTWDQTFSLIRYARIHVGVDSVGNHIAAAYNVPAVIVFGSTDPRCSGYDNAINLRVSDCPPCHIDTKYTNGNRFGETCNNPCINNITPQMIEQAIDSILSNNLPDKLIAYVHQPLQPPSVSCK